MDDLASLDSWRGNHFDCCQVTCKDTDIRGIYLEHLFSQTPVLVNHRVAARSQQGLEQLCSLCAGGPLHLSPHCLQRRAAHIPTAPPTGRTGGSLQSTLGCHQHTDFPSQHSDPLLRNAGQDGFPTTWSLLSKIPFSLHYCIWSIFMMPGQW